MNRCCFFHFFHFGWLNWHLHVDRDPIFALGCTHPYSSEVSSRAVGVLDLYRLPLKNGYKYLFWWGHVPFSKVL